MVAAAKGNGLPLGASQCLTPQPLNTLNRVIRGERMGNGRKTSRATIW